VRLSPTAVLCVTVPAPTRTSTPTPASIGDDLRRPFGLATVAI
jgi:hypothetical protein